jgi:uncharacterized membrane protein
MSDEELGSIPPGNESSQEPAAEPAWGAPTPNYAQAPPPPPGYGQAPYPPPPPPPGYGPPVAGTGLTSNSAAALAYVTFIPAIIFLVMAPYNKDRFVKFHAWQCIVLSGIWFAVAILFTILMFVGLSGMFGLFFLIHLIYRLVELGLFILWLVAIIQASKGVKFKIPIVGNIAESLADKG